MKLKLNMTKEELQQARQEREFALAKQKEEKEELKRRNKEKQKKPYNPKWIFQNEDFKKYDSEMKKFKKIYNNFKKDPIKLKEKLEKFIDGNPDMENIIIMLKIRAKQYNNMINYCLNIKKMKEKNV